MDQLRRTAPENPANAHPIASKSAGADDAKLRLRFSVINLLNKDALYNFNSTFSGTHFVTPRAVEVQAGVSF